MNSDAVAVQKDHDLPDRFLICPGGNDALGPLRSDAVDLLQALGLLFDDLEHRLAERPDQLLGIDRADALDHAGGEIFLDTLGRGRRRRAAEIGAKLYSVRPVVDPPPTRLHELAGADGRSVADNRDQVAMAACLYPQDAEAALLIVEGNALDQAGEILAFRCSG